VIYLTQLQRIARKACTYITCYTKLPVQPMNSSKDYYYVLGVLPSVELVIIKAVYRALAQRYHPDRYNGSAEDAHEKITEINAAYAILSDPIKREAYDKIRGHGAQSEEYFSDDVESNPPNFDPLDADWKLAVEYYPDLVFIDKRLTKISWKLAYQFRVSLLRTQLFSSRVEFSSYLEGAFLEIYFGSNKEILIFAQRLIFGGNKPAAKALNRAIRVLGKVSDAKLVIDNISEKFNIDNKAEKRGQEKDNKNSERAQEKDKKDELIRRVRARNRARSRSPDW
jgi:curved DNA-binding protein CbpA